MASESANQTTALKPSVYLEDTNEVQKVFERFDSNKDGKISLEELAGVMKALGSNTSEEELSCIMVEVDTDKDGYINLEEFAAFCKGSSAYGSGADGGGGDADGGLKELHDAFELYDQDHDGFISADELHQILTRLGERCSVHDCVKMIESVDSNGDGKVGFDEFTKMMTNSNSKAAAAAAP